MNHVGNERVLRLLRRNLLRGHKRWLVFSILMLGLYTVIAIVYTVGHLHAQASSGGNSMDWLWMPSARSSSAEEFSACLLVMDDSHYLVEWLAYHYHSTQLRRLIWVMDPNSRTSPRPIFERWKGRIHSTEWTDSDIYATPAEYHATLQQVQDYFAGSDISPALAKHRARQRLFYYKCLQTLQQEGKHWTMLLDTDEYLTINFETATNLSSTSASLPTPDQPGAVSQFIRSNAIPSEPLSESALLVAGREESDMPPLHFLQSSPCVQVPRIRFGAQESAPDAVQEQVPSGWNGTDFVTMRFRTHARPHDYKANKVSKALVDLSRIPSSDLLPVDSIHLPVRQWCHQRRLHLRTSQSLLKVHHYLGSFDQYTYRDQDARLGKERSEAQWKKQTQLKQAITDDGREIRPWLSGFIQEISRGDPTGSTTAHSLLQGVGVLEPKSWTTYWGDPNQERCALCFFGLPRSFQSMVLPSIIQNVLIPNARHNCDVYVHFYQQYEEEAGRKNRGGTLNPDQVYLLEDAVRQVQKDHGPPSDSRTYREPTISFTYDTEADFWKKRGHLIGKYQNTTDHGIPVYFPYNAKTYQKSSIDNIVKQWHSIEYAFKLMDITSKQMKVNYARVAMLRSDVMYMTPIDIALLDEGRTDSQNMHSVVPGFAQMPINDRMVYGPYAAVKIWATERFRLIEERARSRPEPGYTMHSERFLSGSVFPAMETAGYPTNTNQDICFIRVRADESAMISDCQMGGSTRGWGQVNKKARVEHIIHRNCTRFKMGSQWTFVGCGEGIEYHNGK